MSHVVTITLPDNLYGPIQRLAQDNNQSVESLLVAALQTYLPAEERWQAGFSKMIAETNTAKTPSDDALWEALVLALPEKQRGYITRTPSICGGAPIFTGTRVTVRTVLASLAQGATVEDILTDFPTLNPVSVWSIVMFAASSAQQGLRSEYAH